MINVLTPFLTQFAWQAASPPDILETAMRQLIVQSPVLLIYVVGLVLALVFWKRSSTASICTMIGLILLLLTSIAITFLQNYFFNARFSEHWSTNEVDRALIVSNVIANVIRAAGVIFILVAIFVRRSPAVASNVPDYRTARMK